MNRSIIVIAILLLLGITSLAVLEVTSGTLSGMAFNQITYNYSSKVVIPPTNPNDPNSGSLGGYYKIDGKGKDFNLFMQLTGAEKAESPLDYTADGLKGQGHIDEVKVTPGTIYALLSKDIKGAMFNTTFKGKMNLTCAAWTGITTFENNNGTINGNFTINGVMTYWNGNYTLKRDSGRIVGVSDFVYYPNNKESQAKTVQKTYYM